MFLNEIICDNHNKFVKFVNIENSQTQKILCDECLKSSISKSMIPIKDYIKNLQIYQNSGRSVEENLDRNVIESVHGADIDFKHKKFSQISNQIRDESKIEVENEIKMIFDGFLQSIQQQMQDIQQKITNSLWELIYNWTNIRYIHEKTLTIEGVTQILKSVDQRINSKELNRQIIQLQNGQLEANIVKQKIQSETHIAKQLSNQSLINVQKHFQKPIGIFQLKLQDWLGRIKENQIRLDSLPRNQLQFKIKDMDLRNYNSHSITKAPLILKTLPEAISGGNSPKLEFKNELKTVRIPQSEIQNRLLITTRKKVLGEDSYDFISRIHLVEIFKISVKPNVKQIIEIVSNRLAVVYDNGQIEIFDIQKDLQDAICSFKVSDFLDQIEKLLTPGLFLTLGTVENYENVMNKNKTEKPCVKLIIYNGTNQINEIAEFRDLHQIRLSHLKFISERYLPNESLTNNIYFATYALGEHPKVWIFSYNHQKINSGNIKLLYNIQLPVNMIPNYIFYQGQNCVSFKNQNSPKNSQKEQDFNVLILVDNFNIIYYDLNQSQQTKILNSFQSIEVSRKQNEKIKLCHLDTTYLLVMTEIHNIHVFSEFKQISCFNISQMLKLQPEGFYSTQIFKGEYQKWLLITIVQKATGLQKTFKLTQSDKSKFSYTYLHGTLPKEHSSKLKQWQISENQHLFSLHEDSIIKWNTVQ